MKKHYLVVGGSKGIGRAFVKNALSNGVKISLISRGNIDLEDSNLDVFNHDISDIKGLKNILEKIIATNGEIDTITFFQKYRPTQDVENILEAENRVSLEATQTIIDFMKENFKADGLRSIVLIGSIANTYIAAEQPASYHIAKAGLTGLMKYYAVLLGNDAIRVNSVSPSSVIKDENREFYKQNSKLYDLYAGLSPLNRVGESEDIVNAVNFLLSTQASFITGQDIMVDGGISLQWHESMARKLVDLDKLQVTQKGK